MIPVYVVDTSYLTELYKVPGKSSSTDSQAVRGKFSDAVRSGARIYVPVPCIFELGNHIARSGNRSLAERLRKDVETSLSAAQEPWALTPNADFSVLAELCKRFESNYCEQGIGMTDAFAVFEANRLKRHYRHSARVHIWSKDRKLKSLEPDFEPNPFPP